MHKKQKEGRWLILRIPVFLTEVTNYVTKVDKWINRMSVISLVRGAVWIRTRQSDGSEKSNWKNGNYLSLEGHLKQFSLKKKTINHCLRLSKGHFELASRIISAEQLSHYDWIALICPLNERRSEFVLWFTNCDSRLTSRLTSCLLACANTAANIHTA